MVLTVVPILIDKDGIPNAVDACPDEPGKPDPDPKKNGCPKAFIQGDQIKILDQVKFATNSATIVKAKDSEDVLEAVLKFCASTPRSRKCGSRATRTAAASPISTRS
jgi:hypothetical protein